METNSGTAIIRNNTIVARPTDGDGILLTNSSNEQIYGNTLRFGGSSMGIRLQFNSSRINPDTDLPYDTANNDIRNNTITLRGSARYVAGINCTAGSDCSRFWTSKGNSFQGNTYRVPSRTGMHWILSSATDWPGWQAVGFDTTGTVTSP
jgi:nitrous oxidase accessory protein NosD